MFPKIKIKKRAPHINFKPEQQVISRFLEAVLKNPDDAWAFVSKVYSPRLNLNELREILGNCEKIKISKAFYLSAPKNCLTRSIYVENAEINLNKMLHLRMIKDGGAWKIFGVEQEEASCIKI